MENATNRKGKYNIGVSTRKESYSINQSQNVFVLKNHINHLLLIWT